MKNVGHSRLTNKMTAMMAGAIDSESQSLIEEVVVQASTEEAEQCDRKL